MVVISDLIPHWDLMRNCLKRWDAQGPSKPPSHFKKRSVFTLRQAPIAGRPTWSEPASRCARKRHQGMDFCFWLFPFCFLRPHEDPMKAFESLFLSGPIRALKDTLKAVNFPCFLRSL